MSDTSYLDRREHARESANLRARVFYGQGMAHWADCMIVDLSKGGARLQISSIYPLPSRFVVLQLLGGVVYGGLLLALRVVSPATLWQLLAKKPAGVAAGIDKTTGGDGA